MSDERGSLRDGALLSLGTLTALRVPPPRTVDRRSAAIAMVVAPLAVLPLAILVAGATWFGTRVLDLSTLAVAFAAIALLALGSRALHLDGLSDVADGLTSGHDAERSLAVMKDSAAGPAGVVALVLTLGLQTAALSEVVAHQYGWLIAGLLVCVSRAALAVACAGPVKAARSDGLGVDFVGSVPIVAAVVVWLTCAAAAAGVFAVTDIDWWRGPIAVAAGLVVAVLTVWHCTRRFAGVTGDVFGAAIEITLAVMLLASTTTYVFFGLEG